LCKGVSPLYFRLAFIVLNTINPFSYLLFLYHPALILLSGLQCVMLDYHHT
jgi:hypothetical protein